MEDPDASRPALVYQEALRGLLQQQAAVESLHARAATLIFAASFASSLLGRCRWRPSIASSPCR